MKKSTVRSRKSPGQGLVEFALALPILLLLVFGLIEFARIFAAWLMVENSARTAARYASTGHFNSAYCAQFVPRVPNIDNTATGGTSARALAAVSASCSDAMRCCTLRAAAASAPTRSRNRAVCFSHGRPQFV